MPNWPPKVRALAGAELPFAIKEFPLVGIHCWANWNAYDYVFANLMAAVVDKYDSRVRFFSFDIEADGNIAWQESWKIANVPAFVLYREAIQTDAIWLLGNDVGAFQGRVEGLLDRATNRSATRPHFD